MKEDEEKKNEKVTQDLELQPETYLITKAHDAYTTANRKTSALAIKVGKELASTKLKVKLKKLSWTNYTKKELSHIWLC